MPLRIDRVDARVEVAPAPASGSADGAGADSRTPTPRELMELVRPLVLEVLEAELTNLKRRQG